MAIFNSKLFDITRGVIFWYFINGDLKDPKMEVLYHIFGHIFWGYSLKFRPYI